MRWAERADRLGAGLAVAVTTGVVLTLLAVGGGCELVVGDSLPSFTCEPGAANCPGGSVCVPSTHRCAARSSTCTPGAATGCAAGKRCDEETLQCTPLASVGDGASEDGDDATASPPGDSAADGPISQMGDAPGSGDAPVGDAANGSTDASADAPVGCRGVTCSCSHNPDCDSGICAGELTETTPLATAIGSFCTQPCCTSTDCPGSTVCFGTGGGGSYCVAPGWIGRGVEHGLGVGGATCTGDGECRSALCVNSVCADTCCSGAQQGSECTGGAVCRYAAFPGKTFDTHQTAWCGAAIGNSAGGSPCTIDATCQSGKCASFIRCEAVCRSSIDCTVAGQACSYGLGPTTLPSNKDIVAGCITSTGNAANGSACSSNNDCQSAFCDGGGHCTDVCVTDNDCKPGMHCVPGIVQIQGSYSVLGCES